MSAESLLPPRAVRLGAVCFALGVFLVSWWHWWTFQYGTFDLAFYVQALWLALRGQWHVSLLDVSLLGNHVEPLTFLLLPLFALWSHPMLFVSVQTVALASMAFTGYRIARRLGLESRAASCLALATLLTPATSSVGIYEFHPEALAAPLLLLLIEARLAGKFGRFWLWFAALLACKENFALLLVAFCGVFGLLEWRRGWAWAWRWNLVPLGGAAAWLVLCGKVISPWLNAGSVDYLQLYAQLGSSGGEIVREFFTAPQLAFGALRRALTEGNLVWALLLPLLGLPLLRPRWLLIAAPLLLQHLLSSRFTEWSLGAHYPAPLIPLFWIAAVEGIARWRGAPALAVAILAASALAHLRFGPAREIIAELPSVPARLEERASKAALLAKIPSTASVTASQAFLSHLATRPQLHSLHHLLKGLKTLSRERYVPPPPSDAVLIDYLDTNTFSTVGGFYHPRSRVDAERFVPASDRLLHEYLSTTPYAVEARNEVALFTRATPLVPSAPSAHAVVFDPQTTLLNFRTQREWPGALQFRFTWQFGPDRQLFPWFQLVLSDGHQLFPFTKGACAPQAAAGLCDETWTVAFPAWLPSGDYELFAVFYDASEAAWKHQLPPSDETHILKKIPLGRRHLIPGDLTPDSTPTPNLNSGEGG